MDEPSSTTQTTMGMANQRCFRNSSYDNYDQINVKDLLTKIVVNQKDHSRGDQSDSYQGENICKIMSVSEDAEIQPLLYQNTGQGTERIDKKDFVIDIKDGIGHRFKNGPI